MKFGYWCYSESEDTEEGRRNVNYVALYNNATFLRTMEVIQGHCGVRSWVLPRMGITSNEEHINIVNQQTNMMAKIHWITHKVIERYPLETRREL